MLLRLFLRTLAVFFFLGVIGSVVQKLYPFAGVDLVIGAVLWWLGRKRRPKRRPYTGPTDFNFVMDGGGPPPVPGNDSPVYMTGREYLGLPWRDRRATDRHKLYAASIGIVSTDDVTTGQLHDAGADLHEIPSPLRWEDDEATEPQMRLADRLGIRFSPTSTTRGQMSKAISAVQGHGGG